MCNPPHSHVKRMSAQNIKISRTSETANIVNLSFSELNSTESTESVDFILCTFPRD